MAVIDTINRIYREFRRYTGDGLPNEPANAPLPVGDQNSGPYSAKKSELRAAMIEVFGAAEDAADRAEQALEDALAMIVPDGAVTWPKLADALVQTDVEGGDDEADDEIPTVKRVKTLISAVQTNFYVMPEDFGAAGDGVTDDTVAFDAALDAVVAAGGVLLLGENKTYLLNTWPTNGYYPTGNVFIRGVSQTSKVRGPSGTAYFLRSGSRFDIEGVTFDRWTGVLRRDVAEGGEIIGARFAKNLCQNITGIPINIECPFKDGFIEENTLQDCSGGYGIRIGENTNNVSETVANTAVTIAADTITVASNTDKWITGAKVRVTTTGTIPAGLAVLTDYYVIRASTTSIKLATSYANAVAGTAIDLTSQGTGNHTILHARQDTWSGYQIINNFLRRFTASGSTSGFPILAHGIDVVVNGNDIDGLLSTDGEAVAIYVKLRHSMVCNNKIRNITSTGGGGTALDVAGISLKGAIRSVTNSGVNGFDVTCTGNHIRNIGAQGVKGSGIRCQISDSTVATNIIQDVGHTFISSDDSNGSSRNTIALNKMEAFNILALYGVYLSTFGNSHKILHNSIKDALYGIFVQATSNTLLSTLIDGNSIESTRASSAGFVIGSGGSVAGLLITGNDVILPGTAIVLSNSGSVTRGNIRNNDFAPAISAGATLNGGSSTGLTFSNNP